MPLSIELSDVLAYSVPDTSDTLTFSRALVSSGSVGASGPPNLAVKHALRTTLASVSLTGPTVFQRSLTLASTASVSLSGSSGPGVIHGLFITDSVSVSGPSYPKLYMKRLASVASVSISATTILNIHRSLSSVASVSISASAFLSIRPGVVAKNNILLFESTDSGPPETFHAVAPRDYSLVFADTTVSSYPKPYTLLN